MKQNRPGLALLALLLALAGCSVKAPDSGFSGISADRKPGGDVPFEIREPANAVSVEMAQGVCIDLSGTLSVQPPTTDNGVTTQVTTVTGEDMEFRLVSVTYAQLSEANLEAAFASLLAGFPEAGTARREFTVKTQSGAETTGIELVCASAERTSVSRLFRVGETDTLLQLTAACDAEQIEEARLILDRVQVP